MLKPMKNLEELPEFDVEIVEAPDWFTEGIKRLEEEDESCGNE